MTGEALLFATTKLKLRLYPDDRTRLMNAYLELKALPDVRPALESLKASGLKLALLSNLTPTMLGSNIKSAGLEGMFERVLVLMRPGPSSLIRARISWVWTRSR